MCSTDFKIDGEPDVQYEAISENVGLKLLSRFTFVCSGIEGAEPVECCDLAGSLSASRTIKSG